MNLRLRRCLRPATAHVRLVDRCIDLGFGVVIGTPILLWSRLRPIQIQELLAARIGHLAIEPELFHWRRATGATAAAKVVYFARGQVSNAALLAKWRRALPWGPAWLLGPAFRASRRFAWLNLRPSNWPEDNHSDLRPLDGRDPCWGFNLNPPMDDAFRA